MFAPHDLYPEDLGELLSASAQEPKTYVFSNLSPESDSFVVTVKGQTSDAGEIWWHQRKLNLAGRIFEAQRMVIPYPSQGRGKGRLLMGDLVETAGTLGISQIDIEAQDIGRYAWARFGFVPDRGSWKFQVALEARRRLLRARSQIDSAHFAYYSDVLDSDDPASIRAVASWRNSSTARSWITTVTRRKWNWARRSCWKRPLNGSGPSIWTTQRRWPYTGSMSGVPRMAEQLLYDTRRKSEERRRLLDLIPPHGPALEASVRATLRRSGIQPLDERPLADHRPEAITPVVHTVHIMVE